MLRHRNTAGQGIGAGRRVGTPGQLAAADEYMQGHASSKAWRLPAGCWVMQYQAAACISHLSRLP
jgi:hypothetical protein